MSKEIRTFPHEIIEFNERLLEDLKKQRADLNKVRASLQLDTPGFEEFDLVREKLLAVDRSVKGLTNDLHNHLIRIVGLQARFQELLDEPVKRFVGLHGNKKRTGTSTAKPTTSYDGGFSRAQSSMSYVSLSLLLIVYQF